MLLEKDSQLEVYEEIVKNHSKLIQSFLDIFITSNNKEGTLKFDLSLFTTGTGSYFNMMHRHRFLIEKNQKEHLLHPLMLGFTEIKWRSYLQRFIPMTIFIFMFMAFFSWHCFTYEDLTGCSNDTSCPSLNCMYVLIFISFIVTLTLRLCIFFIVTRSASKMMLKLMNTLPLYTLPGFVSLFSSFLNFNSSSKFQSRRKA